ncbi:hypothetical protein LXA43DRAFT_841183, partial [Ganoderma leucocontextum]
DFIDLMGLQRHTLNQLLLHSAIGSQVPLSLKSAELAFRGLSTFVKASHVTTKDTLAQSLDEFAVDAKMTGHGLQRLFANLYGVIDNILAFTEFAGRELRTLESSANSPDVYDPFTRTFQYSTNILSSEVVRLLLETAAFTEKLDVLDGQLTAVRSLCEQERAATPARDGLLMELWTYLGGNRAMAAQQLIVLEKVDRHQALAVGQVAIVMDVLIAIEADLAELREKLMAPVSVNGLPIEVHIVSIDMGTRRLK